MASADGDLKSHENMGFCGRIDLKLLLRKFLSGIYKIEAKKCKNHVEFLSFGIVNSSLKIHKVTKTRVIRRQTCVIPQN